MNRRVKPGLAVLGCVLAVSATTSVIVEASSNDTAPAARIARGTSLPSADVVKYWSDSRTALSPLLLYVRQLPKAIKAVQATEGRAADAQLREAGNMAEGFATARDLVGRIPVPASAPPGVGELLQVACQLYRQSALAVTELKTVAPGRSGLAVMRRAAALQAVGDRLFDQVRRVLAIDAVGEDQAPIEYRYAPPVPAVADLTGRPAPAQGAERNLDEDLRSAGLLISGAGNGDAGAAPATAWLALRDIATGLENRAGDQAEDVIGARLAIALALLAEGAKVDGQPKSADSLLMLGNDVWNQSRTLEPLPHPAMQQLGAPTRPRSLVWTGGEFDGRPPVLAPGQDVGSGLPGGLPKIDPTQILKG
jgi:hypothetical protein